LKSNGSLFIIGYQKQHFKKESSYYGIFQKFFEFVKPYFDCNADENDNYYINSHSLFIEKFKNFDLKFYEEKIEIDLEFLLSFLKSWSAYVNYMKKKNEKDEDPLIILKKEFQDEIRKLNKEKDFKDIMKIKFDYYNFYFMITLND